MLSSLYCNCILLKNSPELKASPSLDSFYLTPLAIQKNLVFVLFQMGMQIIDSLINRLLIDLIDRLTTN